MREIKFRAWDEGNKVMHFDFQFIRSGVEGNDWIIFISDKFPLKKHETNPFTNPNPYFAQQLKVMQYTGLKDKNGKDIYEGDILLYSGRDSCGRKVMSAKLKVVWENQGAWNIGTTWGHTGEGFFDLFRAEIIGNIYENPELLGRIGGE